MKLKIDIQMLQKITWMRYSIIGVSIILLIGFYSCIGIVERIKTVNYIYKNQTGIDLTMEVYNLYSDLIRTYEIKNHEEVETNTTRYVGPAVFSYNSTHTGTGDSIVLKFSDDKCLSLSKSINSKIFHVEEYDNYSRELTKQEKYTLYFTLTEEHYDSSIECK